MAAPSTPAPPEPLAAATAIPLSSSPVAMCNDAAADCSAPFAFVRGSHLSSPAASFGGLSSLAAAGASSTLLGVTDDGRLLAIPSAPGATDTAWMTPLQDAEGNSLVGAFSASGLRLSDAEGLTRDAEGQLYVSFEREHRVWRYPPTGGRASALGFGPVLSACNGAGMTGGNEGVEALVWLPVTAVAPPVGGQLLAICEGEGSRTDPAVGAGAAPAWLLDPLQPSSTAAIALEYELHGTLRPVDLAYVPGAGLLVLERDYTPGYGNRIALRHVPEHEVHAARAAPGARLQARLLLEMTPDCCAVDNFEGLAVRLEGEQLRLWLASDDNFSSRQRTLLYELTLETSHLLSDGPPSLPPLPSPFRSPSPPPPLPPPQPPSPSPPPTSPPLSGPREFFSPSPPPPQPPTPSPPPSQQPPPSPPPSSSSPPLRHSSPVPPSSPPPLLEQLQADLIEEVAPGREWLGWLIAFAAVFGSVLYVARACLLKCRDRCEWLTAQLSPQKARVGSFTVTSPPGSSALSSRKRSPRLVPPLTELSDMSFSEGFSSTRRPSPNAEPSSASESPATPPAKGFAQNGGSASTTETLPF